MFFIQVIMRLYRVKYKNSGTQPVFVKLRYTNSFVLVFKLYTIFPTSSDFFLY